MFEYLQWLITHLAPLFLATSPFTSYVDQIYSMHRRKSSAGFSLDVPLIMLLASILKIFYWFNEHYDTALFMQAILAICVQIVCLHVALTNRPLPSGKPFDSVAQSQGIFSRRPYEFWQWRPMRPYWTFLAYYTLVLAMLQLIFSGSDVYTGLQGYVALGIEALLPIPQILSNHSSRSCKGFRLSVLANWLLGDTLKMSFFFLTDSDIPLAFKMCGLFQAACDAYLGVQYWMYGEGEAEREAWKKDEL